MTGVGRGLIGFIVGLSVLLVGCMSSPPDPVIDNVSETTASSGIHLGAVLRDAEWRLAHDGALAVRVSVLAQVPTECTWIWGMWGLTDHLNPVMGWIVEGAPQGTWWNVVGGRGSVDASARVHVAGQVDQEAVLGSYGWAMARNDTWPLADGQELTLTLFGVGLQSEDHAGLKPAHLDEMLDEASVAMRISCAHEVTVVHVGIGQEVAVFNEATLRGGAGAHVVGLESSGVTVTSELVQEIESPNATMLVEVTGDILLNHVGVGIVDVAWPGGSERLVDHPTQTLVGCGLGLACPWAERVYEDGPGSYSVSATYASADATGILRGAIIGLEPADGLP